MEMSWIGIYAELSKLCIFLAFAFVASLSLAYSAGFKKGRNHGGTIYQATGTGAVGVVDSAIGLLVLLRIGPIAPLAASRAR